MMYSYRMNLSFRQPAQKTKNYMHEFFLFIMELYRKKLNMMIFCPNFWNFVTCTYSANQRDQNPAILI